MRISDWSSDVCSSDLVTEQSARMLEVARASALAIQEGPVDGHQSRIICYRGEHRRSEPGQSPPAKRRSRSEAQAVRCNIDRPIPQIDRTSAVSGKSVSVRVDLGGRRILKKKTTRTIA